jgi:hypothetical protein
MILQEMKYFLLTLFFIGLAFGSFPAQAQNDVMGGAKTALKTGNSRELAKYFNSNIELIIEAENVDYDKVSNTQAELILKNFFQKYPAKEFNFGHQGSSEGGLQYSTGTYVSGNSTFLVYIVLKQFGGRYMIDRIDFRNQ